MLNPDKMKPPEVCEDFPINYVETMHLVISPSLVSHLVCVRLKFHPPKVSNPVWVNGVDYLSLAIFTLLRWSQCDYLSADVKSTTNSASVPVSVILYTAHSVPRKNIHLLPAQHSQSHLAQFTEHPHDLTHLSLTYPLSFGGKHCSYKYWEIRGGLALNSKWSHIVNKILFDEVW